MSEVTSLKPTSVVSHIYGLKYSKNQNGSSSENFNAKGTSVNNVRQSIDEAYDQFMNEIDAWFYFIEHIVFFLFKFLYILSDLTWVEYSAK